MNFSEFKIDFFDFIFTQVMWQHVESSIAQLFAIVDRHLRWEMGGTWHNDICQRIILKQFNLSRRYKEL